MDLLYSLHYNLRADPDEVNIAIVSSNEEQLVLLFSYSSAASHIAIPNVPLLEVTSGDCIQRIELSYDGTPELDGYCPPPSHIIENEDGQRMTLGQFVTQVHAYPNELKLTVLQVSPHVPSRYASPSRLNIAET
jgi:hypothetical protein